MSGFKKVLPYLIISLVSVTIIVAAIFVVPMMFNGGEDDGAAAPGGRAIRNPKPRKEQKALTSSLGLLYKQS